VSEPDGGGAAPFTRLFVGRARPYKLVDFPGARGVDERGDRIQVALWAPLDAEKRTAKLEAIKYLEGLRFSDLQLVHAPGIGEDERKTQELFIALRDPAQPLRPFAASAADLRLLTTEERDALCKQVTLYGEERAGLKYFESAEEVDGFLAAVGKGLIANSSLLDFDIGSLCHALRIAAGRLLSSTRPSCLDSSSSSGSSAPTSPAPAGA
jgi:hypothetical protein